MIVYMFAFSKKENSTKQPTLTDGTKFQNVQLKEETSVLSPALIFNPGSTGMPTPFNPSYFTYCYIPSFSRYYFVSDWQYLNATWICYLSIDVLASFKTAIGNTSAYVTRSSSHYDGDIIDTFYPTKSVVSYNNDFFSMALSATGFYVLGIISSSAYATDGAVTYYMLTEGEMGSLKSYLLSEGFLTANGLGNLADIPKDLVKSYFNPFEYIVSCRFFPIDYATATTGATSVTAIEVGWWSRPVTGKRMPSGLYSDIQSNTVTAGTHPQASTRGTFLNHAPYTERIMVHPMLGTIVLDANKIDAGDSITIATRVDYTTGDALTYVGNATKGLTLFTQSYRLAIDVQLAQISQDVFQMGRAVVNTITGAVAGAATGAATGGTAGAIVGGIGGAASGIMDFIQATQPVLSTSGSNGNRSVYHVAVYLQAFYKLLVDEDRTDKGRPLCKVKTLNTLSGLIVCSNAHAEMVAFDEEKTRIENYLNGGFFYE